jgi:hypothetical protein
MFQINIKKILGITELESSRLKLCWGARFLFQVGFIVSWIMLTALFVEQFGIHNLLWFFLFDAVLYFGGAFIASVLAPRLELRNFLLVAVSSTALLVGSSFFFRPDQLAFFILVILAKDLFFGQVNIALNRLTEHLYSPFEAQRFMPKIESAITVGSVVGAALMVLLIDHISDQSVLWLWMGALIGIGFLSVFMRKILHTIPSFRKPHAPIAHKKNPITEAVHGIGKIRFLRHMLVILLLQVMVFTVIEFEFTKEIQSHIVPHGEQHEVIIPTKALQTSFFTEVVEKAKEVQHVTQEKVETISSKLIMRKSLAHDLGVFHLFFALFALCVQLILTPRVLAYFGIIGAMFSYFFILFAGLFLMLMGHGSVALVRALQHGTHSLGESAYHMSFYSIFSHRRESVRLFMEGIIRPFGIILGVGLLFFVPSEFLFPIAAVMTAGLMLLCIPSRKSFTQLSKANLDSEQNIEGKLHSVEILGQKGHRNSTDILSQKLKHKDEGDIIREKIIRTISDINNPRAVHTYLSVLRDEKENLETKMKVADSLFKLDIVPSYWQEHAFTQYHLRETLEELFEKAKHPHFKKLLVMNIFKHSPSHEVAPFFLKTMQKADDKLKTIYLRSCLMFNDPEIVFYVRKYLEHKDPRIKSHAVIALWKFEEKAPLREILENLVMSENEKDRVSGLYAFGEVKDKLQRERIIEFLDHQSQNVRLHALVALAKLGDHRAVEGLLEILFGEDQKLSQKAFYMLDRVPKDMRQQLQRKIQREVSREVRGILHSEAFHLSPQKKTLNRLKWLYRMAGRHDDILAMEGFGK